MGSTQEADLWFFYINTLLARPMGPNNKHIIIMSISIPRELAKENILHVTEEDLNVVQR
jgi:hypothetical protein